MLVSCPTSALSERKLSLPELPQAFPPLKELIQHGAAQSYSKLAAEANLNWSFLALVFQVIWETVKQV